MIGSSRSVRWFDPLRDTFHMHVDCEHYLEERDTLDGNPLPPFLNIGRRAARISIGATLARNYDDWQTERLLMANNIRECCLVLAFVTLHVLLQAATASGLFDDDTRIRLVDALNHAEIDRYRRLFKAHIIHQNDFRTADFFEKYVDNRSLIGGVSWTAEDWMTVIHYTNLAAREKNPATSPAQMGYGSSEAIWDRDEQWEEEYYPHMKPNFAHPLVQDAMARRPNYFPAIMMRLCVRDCYADVQCVPQHLDGITDWGG